MKIWAGPRGVLLAWLVACLVLLGMAAPMMAHMITQDPDDYMRLLEVRDLLAGQSWWDVHQYRMNPPFGADMHWSRLVDLPIAGALVAFRAFLPDHAATIAAMALVPLLELLAAMLVARRLTLALGESEKVAWGAAALIPLFPVLTSTFLPMRIDHHGWQGVMALACAWASLRHDARGAAITGLCAAVWLTISLEGLMLVAALTGLMAWRYAARGERALAPYLGAAAAAMALLFALTRPLASLPHPAVDAVSWPHIAAFAICAALAALLPRLPGQRSMAGRVAGLALVGLAGVAIMLGALGLAAANPFSRMDPLVHQWWFLYIPEGLPITAQDPSTIAMELWTLVLAGWGVWAVRARRPWHEISALLLVASLLSLVVMRSSVAAQLLCAPFSAVLLARWLPRAQAIRLMPLRVSATLLCLLGLTPSLASAAGKQVERLLPHHGAIRAMGAPQAASAGCGLDALNRLPKAHIFATLDLGPEILVRTPHTVVISGYHRNDAKMREVIEAFSGDPAGARGIVRANHAAYVVLCAGDTEPRVLASRRADNLAAGLLAGHVPGWLAPQPGFGQGLLVYKVL